MSTNKIQLTRQWKNRIHSGPSSAGWKNVHLVCRMLPYDHGNWWRGAASIGGSEKKGPARRSVAKAKQDAERLAVELLLDIRDGVKMLMAKHGIDEED